MLAQVVISRLLYCPQEEFFRTALHLLTHTIQTCTIILQKIQLRYLSDVLLFGDMVMARNQALPKGPPTPHSPILLAVR